MLQNNPNGAWYQRQSCFPRSFNGATELEPTYPPKPVSCSSPARYLSFSSEWCGCTFSFLRCGCTFSFLRCGCTSTSRFSATNCATSPRKPNFQSPLHVLKFFSQWYRYTSTSLFSTAPRVPSTPHFLPFPVFYQHGKLTPEESLNHPLQSSMIRTLPSLHIAHIPSLCTSTLLPIDFTNMEISLTSPGRASIIRVSLAWSEPFFLNIAFSPSKYTVNLSFSSTKTTLVIFLSKVRVFFLYMRKLPSFYLKSVWLPQSQWCMDFSSMKSVVANIWNAWFCPPKNISYNHAISLLKIQPTKAPRFSPCVVH